MEIKKLLEELEPLTIKQAKEVLVKEGCYNEEDLNEYDFEESSISTMYDDYKVIKAPDYLVIRQDDLVEYAKDLARWMGQKLPDGMEYYFDHDSLGQDMEKDPVLIYQAQYFLEEMGEDIDYKFEKVTPADYNCYIVYYN